MKSIREKRGILTCIVVMIATCMVLPLPAMASDTASSTAAFMAIFHTNRDSLWQEFQ